MKQTKLLGAAHEVAFALECLERGAVVSQPLGDNSAYDLIVDVNGNLHRIQCKRGGLEVKQGDDGTVEKWSVSAQKPGTKTAYTLKEVDFIVSLCGERWYIWKITEHKNKDKDGKLMGFPKSIKTYPGANPNKYEMEWGRDNWFSLGLPSSRLSNDSEDSDTESDPTT